ncbi:MAG: PQQ-binding-like beta-propeller repeat protein [Gemmatales bacterium]
MLRWLLASFLAVICAVETSADDNWTHWRGPNANGTAPQADPPTKWDGPTGKNIKWKAPLVGRGSATPIIWGSQVFIVSEQKTDREAKPEEIPKPITGVERMTTPPKHFYRFLVTSYDRATGKVNWQKIATEAVPHEGHHETHSYAAGSPTTDGERLYVSFGSFGIFCYDLKGNKLWERQLGRLTTRRGWGEAVTPVLYKGSLLLNWDQELDSALYCLDASTGKTVWKANRDEVTTWTTPFVTEYQGRTQVIMNGTRAVRSHDLADGKVIWTWSGMTVNAIPSVFRYGDAAIAVSGYQGSQAVSIPLSSQGDLTKEGKLNWRYQAGTPYVPSAVLVGDQLCFCAANTNVLTVLDAVTGKPVQAGVRLPGVRQFYASPIYAGGRLYFTDRDGVTQVLKPGKQPNVVATNKLDDPVDASPVAVGKQLFLRGEKFLYCIEGQE